MGKYLLQLSYSLDGIRAVRTSGGSAREANARTSAESVGGRVDAFYFAFGGTDAFLILDLPDNATAAAVASTVAASGLASVSTTVLLTPAEMDTASKTTVTYAGVH